MPVEAVEKIARVVNKWEVSPPVNHEDYFTKALEVLSPYMKTEIAKPDNVQRDKLTVPYLPYRNHKKSEICQTCKKAPGIPRSGSDYDLPATACVGSHCDDCFNRSISKMPPGIANCQACKNAPGFPRTDYGGVLCKSCYGKMMWNTFGSKAKISQRMGADICPTCKKVPNYCLC